jgi:hypothetical protein
MYPSTGLPDVCMFSCTATQLRSVICGQETVRLGCVQTAMRTWATESVKCLACVEFGQWNQHVVQGVCEFLRPTGTGCGISVWGVGVSAPNASMVC